MENNKSFYSNLSFIIAFILILFLCISVRTSNIDGLKDITTGNYTLGPDLDPFLYLRNAQNIVNGNLKPIDTFVAAPLGTQPYAYGSLMPWMIVGLYKFLNFGGDVVSVEYCAIILPVIYAYGSLMPWMIVGLYKFLNFGGDVVSVEYCAIILPVILACIALIFFTLFLQKIFSFIMSRNASWIGALAGALLYSVAPEMIHRTTAGIPEIESLGMVFFWMAFYFFLCAWKSDKNFIMTICAMGSGLATGAMIWTWGGYRYIFMIFALSFFIYFFTNTIEKKKVMIYNIWWCVAIIIFMLKPEVTLRLMFSSLFDIGFSGFVFIIANAYVMSEKFQSKRFNQKILVVVVSIVALLFLATIALGPSFVIGKIGNLLYTFISPFGDERVRLTVAENQVPYFTTIYNSFIVPFFTSVISLVLFFFAGAITLFYYAVKHFNNNNKHILFGSFILFLLGMTISKISPTSLFNGTNFISQIVYYGSLILFSILVIKIYLDETKKDNMQHIEFSYIMILAMVVITIISMRGAIRLLFVITPFVILSSAYLVGKIYSLFEDETPSIPKYTSIALVILSIAFTLLFAYHFGVQSYNETSQTLPGTYEHQWQYAMDWVRNNTPIDSIFVFWWDYGYWVQTIGQRPTVTDGAHAVNYWDHTTARYLMTAEHEETTLQLCKAMNVSYILFDSTDVGKYGAYATIGSDSKGQDRLAYIPTYLEDPKQMMELKNGTTHIYTGGTALDEDFMYNGTFYPSGLTVIIGFLVTFDNNNTVTNAEAVLYTQRGLQARVPINYVYNDKNIKVNSNGLNSTLYIVPRIVGSQVQFMGAMLYLSPKITRGQFARMYLLGETNMTLVHTESAEIITQMRSQGITTGEFVVANQLYGPIKIFAVGNVSNVSYHPEYLERKAIAENDYAKLDYLGT